MTPAREIRDIKLRIWDIENRTHCWTQNEVNHSWTCPRCRTTTYSIPDWTTHCTDRRDAFELELLQADLQLLTSDVVQIPNGNQIGKTSKSRVMAASVTVANAARHYLQRLDEISALNNEGNNKESASSYARWLGADCRYTEALTALRDASTAWNRLTKPEVLQSTPSPHRCPSCFDTGTVDYLETDGTWKPMDCALCRPAR